MSPTIFKEKGYRFFVFSREEPRIHVHVICTDGEAKYWLEPDLELANNHHLSRQQLKEIEQLIKEHYNDIKNAWGQHFQY